MFSPFQKFKLLQVVKNSLLQNILLCLIITYLGEWLCNKYIEQGYYKFFLTSIGFAVNFLMLFFTVYVLTYFTKRRYFSLFIVFSSSIFFSLLNINKEIFLDAPFFLSDFLLVYQFLSLIPKYWKQLVLPLGLLLVLLFLTYKFLKYLWHKKISLNARNRLFFLSGSSILIIIIFLLPKTLFSQIEKKIGLSQNHFNVSAKYRENGFLYSFFCEIRNSLHSEKPRNFNEKNITKLFKKDFMEYKKYLTMTIFEKEKINIIYYLGESFYDPSKININVSPNPVKNFHRISQRAAIHGELIVPVKGGQTANTEFEILTSLSTNFVSGIAYTNSIKSKVESIASNLAKQDYQTTAIHSFVKWYWSRDFVYPRLGIKNFYDHDFLKEQTKAGYYVSDQAMIRSSFNYIEKQDPLFLFLIGMVSHGPYASNYVPVKFSVKSNYKIEKPKQFQTNLNLLRDVDLAINSLITKLRKSKKKYIVFFFGDHYPLHDHIGKTFSDATKKNLEDMYSLPFFVWSNFPNSQKKIKISSNYITPAILSHFKIKMNLHQFIINNLAKENPQFSKSIQNSVNLSPQQLAQFIERYKIIQYDILNQKKLILQTYNLRQPYL